jgi:hypothetical protein
MDSLLLHSDLDQETQQIATVINKLSKISNNVVYTVFHEERQQHQHQPSPPQLNATQDMVDNMVVDNDKLPSFSRYICIVHVLYDETFHKYHRRKDKGDLPLFRGFSFQLIGGQICGTTTSTTSNDGNDSFLHDAVCNEFSSNPSTHLIVTDDTDGSLMLKMKFLPYMV